MDNKNRKPIKPSASGVAITALCFTVISLGASAEQSTVVDSGSLNDVTVTITFDSNGCPTGVSDADFTVTKAKWIIWQPKPEDVDFSIYFDPFKGKRNDAKKGEVKRKFAKDAPPRDDSANPDEVIEYKYTIVGNDCKGDALDPRFRLRR